MNYCAAQAFTEKTISYLHKGSPKFDVPFTSGDAWQGPVELDEVTQTRHLQVAVPILSNRNRLGVLVAGINMTKLENVTSKWSPGPAPDREVKAVPALPISNHGS